jgi:hypothetical protein
MPAWATSDKGGIVVEDLVIHGPFTGRITSVQECNVYDRPGLEIKFEGCKKSYFPCLTVRKLLAAFMPKDLKQWPGIHLRIFADTSVKFGPEATGGVRLEAASCLTKPFSMSVCMGRRRQTQVVKPLKISEPQEPPAKAATGAVDKKPAGPTAASMNNRQQKVQ